MPYILIRGFAWQVNKSYPHYVNYVYTSTLETYKRKLRFYLGNLSCFYNFQKFNGIH